LSYCYNCGTELKDFVSVCPECGTDLSAFLPIFMREIKTDVITNRHEKSLLGDNTHIKMPEVDFDLSDLDLSPLKSVSQQESINPVIPLVASLAVSGLGQCLNGEPVKGIFFVIGFLLMYLPANFKYPPLYILAFAVQAGGGLHAYIHSRKVNAGLIKPKHVAMRTVILYVIGYIAIFISLFSMSVMLIAVF